MIDFSPLLQQPALLAALSAAGGFLLGALLLWLLVAPRLRRAREEARQVRTELEANQRLMAVERETRQAAEAQLRDAFGALAADALKRNSSEFLKLAEENLKRFQAEAKSELGEREKAVESLVKPIREALERTEREVRRMENERREAFGSLHKHLETMAQSHRLLHSETRNLVQALRRPEVRGQWGELTLKRLAELAGMVEYCDFVEQEQVKGDGGAMRPDMVVRMPDQREIVVDAKTSLDAYLAAVEASDDSEREAQLVRHARKVRERVKELSAKAYWQQFPRSPDFVVLFIPGDQFLSAALDKDRKLIEDALANRVVIATPTSLVGLLRAIAYGWRQAALAENAERIREAGEDLYARLHTFAEHLARLGRSLDSSVTAYNKAVGSFDARVLPSARRFTELGITANKEIQTPEQIERAPRQVENRGQADDAGSS